ncbi:acetate--CoA ligase family protein [Hydrogenophaga sp.]|uniref:acetate--CoA ligase family protein n=1 Tax=Hydrogenophaga sp. TaxID=1904254 RepID=UPI00260D0948|nr:acetate--CoA ligase family protein [Hydrogenophaga sp.]MCW5653185.1 acetate--CoA ligase family protein [Hydrogenophaga sp.]
MSGLSSLFNPRSVVLVGATDRSTWSKMAYDNLRLLGFAGKVHLVSRSGGQAHGQQTFTSVAEIGEPVDVALLMVPIAAMNDALRDLGAAGVKSAVVLAGGFAETGAEGRALQDAMVATARSLGIRLLGPNCLGFINFNTGGVCWTGSMRTPPLKGGISIVSQSGAVATVMKHFAHQHGIGLNVVAATGNEAALGLAEVVDYLVDDPQTRVITVFAESVRDTALLRAAAARALHAGKPIVVLKVGRSEITVQAAQSHTGSLVGDDGVFDGVCRQFGLLRVRSIEELMFTAALLEKTGVLQGEGVAVLSASGGMGELAADYAHLEGVALPRLAPQTLDGLAAALPPMATPANPLDLTGAVVNKPELFLECMQVLEQDPAISVLVCVFDVPTDLNNDWAPFAVGSLQAIGRFKPQGRVRFLAISNTVKYVSDRSRAEIAAAGLPYLACGLDVGMKALRHAQRWSAQQRELGAQATDSATAGGVTPPAAWPSSEREAMAYLAGAGVAVVPQVLAETEAAAVAAAGAMGGGPVVLKIASPDIAHKTEVGGVLLNLQGEAAVAEGFRRIMASARAAQPRARLEGVVVSPMRRGGVELFVGVRRDAQWGHVLALGLGGVWIEALKDVSLRVLPVSPDEVRRMVGELRGASLLGGFRGAAPVDLDGLARLVARIGDAALALGDGLDTLEVNPLLAEGDRIEALDALATHRSPGGTEPHP